MGIIYLLYLIKTYIYSSQLYQEMQSSNKNTKDVFSKMRVKDYKGGHRKKVSTLDWNCQGTQLASASHDGSIRFWDLHSSGLSKRVSIQKAHSDIVEEVKFHPINPNILASVSTDAVMKIWDARVGKKDIK